MVTAKDKGEAPGKMSQADQAGCGVWECIYWLPGVLLAFIARGPMLASD